jgi:hypothetical protein
MSVTVNQHAAGYPASQSRPASEGDLNIGPGDQPEDDQAIHNGALNFFLNLS